MAENQVPGDNQPEQDKPATTSPGATMSTGLEQNVAGLLCYVLTWVTGIIFLLVEKENRFVRFHAVQAIGVGVVWTVGWIILNILNAALSGGFGTFISTVGWLILGLGGLAIWIVLMIKAYQGEMWQLPVIGEIAQREADKLQS